jgi:hypothetical protein
VDNENTERQHHRDPDIAGEERRLRRRGLACTPEPSTAACSIWSGPDT